MPVQLIAHGGRRSELITPIHGALTDAACKGETPCIKPQSSAAVNFGERHSQVLRPGRSDHPAKATVGERSAISLERSPPYGDRVLLQIAPLSTKPDRMRENFDITALPEDAMREIRDGVTTRVRFNTVVKTGVPGFIPRGN
jgi:hypothetical protein